MKITITPKDNVQFSKSFYKIKCVKCGAEFICSSDDISSEKRPNGTRWVSCPECGECIYWSPDHVNNSIETISEEEYVALKAEYEVINEVRENSEKENN